MDTRIFAHRGAAAYAPENTLSSFELALEQGADGIELDVHLSKDGRLVIMHDERVDRTTNAKGYIKDYTLEELKSFDASNGMAGFENAKIPTLEEVYGLFKGNEKLINLEIKTDIVVYPGIVDKVLQAEAEFGLAGRMIYSSFNHYTICELLKKKPDAKVGLLYMSMIVEPWSYAERLGAKCLHPHFITLANTPNMAKECNERGLETNIWTVDEPFWMENLAKMGVTSIITNKPDVAVKTVLGR